MKETVLSYLSRREEANFGSKLILSVLAHFLGARLSIQNMLQMALFRCCETLLLCVIAMRGENNLDNIKT